MSDAFPVTKLFGLLVRQISSPIAARIKEYAKNHNFFKKHVCMATARLYYWWDLRAKMWVLKLGRPVNIPVLSERDAINLGGDILGEAVVFFVGAAVLVAELNRQGNKEELKKQVQQAEIQAVIDSLQELKQELHRRQDYILELRQRLKEHEQSMRLNPERKPGH